MIKKNIFEGHTQHTVKCLSVLDPICTTIHIMETSMCSLLAYARHQVDNQELHAHWTDMER